MLQAFGGPILFLSREVVRVESQRLVVTMWERSQPLSVFRASKVDWNRVLLVAPAVVIGIGLDGWDIYAHLLRPLVFLGFLSAKKPQPSSRMVTLILLTFNWQGMHDVLNSVASFRLGLTALRSSCSSLRVPIRLHPLLLICFVDRRAHRLRHERPNVISFIVQTHFLIFSI